MEDTYFDLLPHENILNIMYELPADDIINICKAYDKLSFVCYDWIFWSNIANRDFNFPIIQFREQPRLPNEDAATRYYNIKYLLKDKIKKFEFSIINGSKYIFDVLINYVDPSISFEKGLSEISDAVIKKINKTYPERVGLNNNNHTIYIASLLGHTYIVDKLLKDKRVNIPNIINESIKFAEIGNNSDTINRLLKECAL